MNILQRNHHVFHLYITCLYHLLNNLFFTDFRSKFVSLMFHSTGIGWGMVSISAMVCIYYNVIIMYSIYYMFVSFVNLDGEVPWIDCDNPWNTKQCRQEAYPSFGEMKNDTEKIYELSSKLILLHLLRVCFICETGQVHLHVYVIYALEYCLIGASRVRIGRFAN